MNIGLFGGTFNPPHLGHRKVAEKAIALLSLDLLYVMPAAVPPHKQMAKGAADAQRLEMTRLAFADLSGAAVSDWELLRGGTSYTVDTVSALRRRYPQDRLYLLVGGDMLATLDTWHRASELLALCTVVAFQREGSARELERDAQRLRVCCGAEVVLLEGDFLEVSSTEIRTALDGGEAPPRCLSPAVKSYICRNKLYGLSRLTK